MNGYRKYLIDHQDENMSWCRHYSNGDVSVVVCEGKVDGVEIPGRTLPANIDDRVPLAARLLTGDTYEDYKGYSDEEIVLENLTTETGCSACPYFEFCEACDNPDGWDEDPESVFYPDDDTADRAHPAIYALYREIDEVPRPERVKADLEAGTLEFFYGTTSGRMLAYYYDPSTERCAAVYMDTHDVLDADDLERDVL